MIVVEAGRGGERGERGFPHVARATASVLRRLRLPACGYAFVHGVGPSGAAAPLELIPAEANRLPQGCDIELPSWMFDALAAAPPPGQRAGKNGGAARLTTSLSPASTWEHGVVSGVEVGAEQKGSSTEGTRMSTATSPADCVVLSFQDSKAQHIESSDRASRRKQVASQINGLPVVVNCVIAARHCGSLRIFTVKSVHVDGESARAGRIISPQTNIELTSSSRDSNMILSSQMPRAGSLALPVKPHSSQEAFPQYLTNIFRTTPTFADPLDELNVLLRETLKRDSETRSTEHDDQQMFIPTPRGILLSGCRGSGKTALVKHFAENTARRVLQCAVHYLSGADLLTEVEKVLEEGSSRMCPTLDHLQNLYCRATASTAGVANQRSRVVVVVDDLDALGAIRQSSIENRGVGARLERGARGVAVRQFLSFCEEFCAESVSKGGGTMLIGMVSDASLVDTRLLEYGKLSHVVRIRDLDVVARRCVSAALMDAMVKSSSRSPILNKKEHAWGGAPLNIEDKGDQQSYQSLHHLIAKQSGGFVLRDFVKLYDRAIMLASEESHSTMDPRRGACDNGNELDVNASHFTSAFATIRPSRLDNLDVRVPAVSFADDIGGYSKVKSRLRKTILWQWSRADAMERLGVSSSSGLLLYGPSGCGKTMIAEGLAKECRCNFVAVKLQDLFSPFLGESEAFLRYLFRTARKATPCMLFLDDLDTVAAKRDLSGGDSGSGSSGVAERILATLLNEMDGIESNKGVVVVAATNRRDAVDPALLRPGRLDVTVEVGIPTAEDREDILRVHTRRMPLGAGVDLSAIALDSRWSGRSVTGAGLRQLCQTAAFAAMRERDAPEEVGREHFEKAMSMLM